MLANPNHVLFYNPHQEYRRTLVDPDGYSCVFVGVTPDLLAELVGRSGRLRRIEAVSDRECALLRHLTLAAVRTAADPLHVEELLYALLARVVAAGFAGSPAGSGARRAATRRAHRALAEDAKRLLTIRMTERVSLEALARSLYTSPFHLARVFRAETGFTLHAYQVELRARAALERLRQPGTELTALARELGYASPSHFSDSFYAAFGVRPSALALMRPTEVRRILEAEASSPT